MAFSIENVHGPYNSVGTTVPHGDAAERDIPIFGMVILGSDSSREPEPKTGSGTIPFSSLSL